MCRPGSQSHGFSTGTATYTNIQYIGTIEDRMKLDIFAKSIGAPWRFAVLRIRTTHEASTNNNTHTHPFNKVE